MRYYLQRADDPASWEEVDQFVAANYQYATSEIDNDAPRYSGNWAAVADGNTITELHLKDQGNGEATPFVLSLLMRLLNITPVYGSKPGGFCSVPELVPFVQRRSRFLHSGKGDFIVKKKAA